MHASSGSPPDVEHLSSIFILWGPVAAWFRRLCLPTYMSLSYGHSLYPLLPNKLAV